jgi:glyoxylase-like metal-dependent hydrolase (beta-lactamase superfamily II)
MSSGWFRIERLEGDVLVVRDPGYAQPSLVYIVEGQERAAVIDAGLGLADLRALVADLTEREPVVLQTHAHPDHAGSSHQFERVLAHPLAAKKLRAGWSNTELRFNFQKFFKERALPEGVDPETFAIPAHSNVEEFEDRAVVDLGGRQLDVFFTPGHSADSVCFLDLENGLLFTGDSVHAGRIAIEDGQAYRRSIDRIHRLASLATAIYPAHGETPIQPDFVARVRRGFIDALSDRRPSGFLAGFATFEFDGFGLMLPPRRRRLKEQ